MTRGLWKGEYTPIYLPNLLPPDIRLEGKRKTLSVSSFPNQWNQL